MACFSAVKQIDDFGGEKQVDQVQKRLRQCVARAVPDRDQPNRECAGYRREKHQHRLPGVSGDEVRHRYGEHAPSRVLSVGAASRSVVSHAVGEQLDHFHAQQEARRTMRRFRYQAARALDEAERVQKVVARQDRRGLKKSGVATQASRCWQAAEAAMDRWSAAEAAWKKFEPALEPFTSEGDLNTRERADAAVAAVMPELAGPEWAKVRRMLARPEMFTYLDRLHEQVEALPGDPAVKHATSFLDYAFRHLAANYLGRRDIPGAEFEPYGGSIPSSTTALTPRPPQRRSRLLSSYYTSVCSAISTASFTSMLKGSQVANASIDQRRLCATKRMGAKQRRIKADHRQPIGQ